MVVSFEMIIDLKLSILNIRQSKLTDKIYNSLGIEIKTLVNEYQRADIYSTSFNADLELSSGVYFYQLKAGNTTQTKKMILLK